MSRRINCVVTASVTGSRVPTSSSSVSPSHPSDAAWLFAGSATSGAAAAPNAATRSSAQSVYDAAHVWTITAVPSARSGPARRPPVEAGISTSDAPSVANRRVSSVAGWASR